MSLNRVTFQSNIMSLCLPKHDHKRETAPGMNGVQVISLVLNPIKTFSHRHHLHYDWKSYKPSLGQLTLTVL